MDICYASGAVARGLPVGNVPLLSLGAIHASQNQPKLACPVLAELRRDTRQRMQTHLMGQLYGRDYERMLDLAVAVVNGMLREEPWFLITRELNDCLHGNATIFEAHMNPALRISKILAWAPESAGATPFEPRVRAHGGEHPLAQVFATGGKHVPLTVNDLVDGRTWRRNSWYHATHRRFDGAIRHLGLPLPCASGTVRALITCRPGRDFGT